MAICDYCKHKKCEEITDGLYEYYCEEDSPNFTTDDGCYHYEEAYDGT